MIGCLSLIAGATANAAQISANDPYYQISNIEVSAKPISAQAEAKAKTLNRLQTEFRNEQASQLIDPTQSFPGMYPQGGEGGGGLAIAQIALKVWDIIQENKAVLNVSRQNVKALPNIAKTDWTQLTGWKPQHGIELTLSVKNFYNIEVIRLSYVVDTIYGGSVRGQGKYIASARVVPRNIDVLWGFSMDVNVAEVAVQNIGTEASPIAAITLDVGVTYGSILQKTSFTNSYKLTGDGLIVDLNSGKRYFEN
jgi:hypothetical protein